MSKRIVCPLEESLGISKYLLDRGYHVSTEEDFSEYGYIDPDGLHLFNDGKKSRLALGTRFRDCTVLYYHEPVADAEVTISSGVTIIFSTGIAVNGEEMLDSQILDLTNALASWYLGDNDDIHVSCYENVTMHVYRGENPYYSSLNTIMNKEMTDEERNDALIKLMKDMK